eukprot:scaffold117178_cov21-Phaeocystis_antarctica.AAC.2
MAHRRAAGSWRRPRGRPSGPQPGLELGLGLDLELEHAYYLLMTTYLELEHGALDERLEAWVGSG